MNSTLETRERQRARHRSFITFFTIVLTVYSAINFYIFTRLNQAIPDGSWFRTLFIPLFIFIAASYIVGQFLERKKSSFVSDSLTWIGALWLGALGWFLLAIVAIDIVRLADFAFHFLPNAWYVNGAVTKETVGTVGTVVILLGMTYGFFNARNIRVKPLAITIDKPRVGGSLRIAMISDMHMGTIIGEKMVEQMVAKINSIKPDLVLMAGDQIDGNPHPVMQQDLGKILEKIKSKHGVYAITGNHEYIGNAETACAYLEAHGVKMIRDNAVEVAGVYLVGREDGAAKQFAHLDRKPLADLVAPLDKSKPIILMDHTPFHLEEAEQNGCDLQVSGHTHHAQIWPFSFITKRVYEVSWGYKKKGNTHVYVSCGAGTWGPPIRIGNRPEVMDITVSFKS